MQPGPSQRVAFGTIVSDMPGGIAAPEHVFQAAFEAHRWPLIDGDEADIAPVSNVPAWSRPLGAWRADDALGFRPHFGWTGTIEWDRDQVPTSH